MSCPSEHEIQQAQSGQLSAGRMAEVLGHAVNCDTCCKFLDSSETTFLNLGGVGGACAPAVLSNPSSCDRVSSESPVDTGDSKLKSTDNQVSASVDLDLTGVLPASEGDIGAHVASDAPAIVPSHIQSSQNLFGTGTLEISSEIARGGMGAVLHGHDTRLHRDVAVKVLLERHLENTELLQRFVEEAQIHGQLQHPGVAPVYQVGEFVDRRPFFTMKLVKGKTLAKLLASRKETGEERSRFIGIFEQVCQTLAYAHSRKVIHRDLKPANIMVGAFGEVQVMDWGLAKVLTEPIQRSSATPQVADVSVIRTARSEGSTVEYSGGAGSNTQAGSILGTPAYMPPEQAIGDVDSLDERADVFGLGAILCEILTGLPPYVGQDATQIWRKAARADLADALTRLDQCGADSVLVSITRKCLAADPGDRPRDAQSLATALREYQESVQEKLRLAELARVEAQARVEEEEKRRVLSDQLASEVQARSRADLKRRRTSFALVALLMVSALVTMGALYWFQRREADLARRETQKQLNEALMEKQRNEELVLLNQRIEAESRAARLQSDLSQDASYRAKRHQARSEYQSVKSRAASLAAQAQQLIATRNPVGMGLAIESVRTTEREGQPTLAAAIQAVRDALSSCHGMPIRDGEFRPEKLVVSPDGRWLAGIDYLGASRLWDLLDATRPFDQLTLGPLDCEPIEIAFSLDSRWLVAIGRNGEVTLYQLDGKQPAKGVVHWNVANIPSGGSFNGVSFSADNNYVAISWTYDEWRDDLIVRQTSCSLLRLDVERPTEHRKTWETKPTGWVLPGFSPNAKWFVGRHTDGENEVLQFWNAQSPESDPKLIRGIFANRYASDTRFRYSSDDRWLVIDVVGVGLTLYDLDSPEPDANRRVLVAYSDNQPSSLPRQSSVSANSPFELSPDRRWVVLGGADGNVYLWRLGTSDPPRILVPPAPEKPEIANDPVTFLEFPGGRQWLVAGQNTVRVWDLSVEEPEATRVVLATNSYLTSISAKRPLIALQDASTGSLWDLEGPRPLEPAYRFQPTDRSMFAGWMKLPDSNRVALATVNPDNMRRGDAIHLFDLTATDVAKSETRFIGHQAAVWQLRMSSDRSQLIAVGVDLTLDFWSVPQSGVEASPIHPRSTSPSLQNLTQISCNGRFAIAEYGAAWILDSNHPEQTPESSLREVPVDLQEVPQLSKSGTWVYSKQKLWPIGQAENEVVPVSIPDKDPSYQFTGFSSNGNWATFYAASTRQVAIQNLNQLQTNGFSPVPIELPTNEIQGVFFSRNGRFAALVNAKICYVLDLTNLNQEPQTSPISFPLGSVPLALEISETGRYVAGFFGDVGQGAWRLWDLNSDGNRSMKQQVIERPNGLNRSLFAANDRWWIAGSNTLCEVWETVDPNAGLTFSTNVSTGGVNELTMSPNERWLAVVAFDNIQLIDTWVFPLGSRQIRLTGRQDIEPSTVCISSDGQLVAAQSHTDTSVFVWDLSAREMNRSDVSPVKGEALSPIVIRESVRTNSVDGLPLAGIAFAKNGHRLLTLNRIGQLRSHIVDQSDLLAIAKLADTRGYSEGEFSTFLGEQYQKVVQQIDLQIHEMTEKPADWNQALDLSVSLDCVNVPLGNVMDRLGDAIGLPIIFDHQQIEKQGVRFDDHVTMTIRGTSLRSLFEVLLKTCQIGCSFQGTALWVTSLERDELKDLPLSQLQSDRHKLLLESLKKPITVSHSNTSLQQIVSVLEQQASCTIYIDSKAVRALENLAYDDPLIYKFQSAGESMDEVLNRLLTPLHLGYELQSDLIRITAKPVPRRQD